MNLLDLMVKISVDDQASSKVTSISNSIKSGLGTAAKVGALAMTATVAAVGGVTTAMAGAVNSVADYGDHIDKMSQKMNMSAQAYQEWDSVMRHSGTSIETMKAGMKTLANAVENGNEAFQRIGLTQEQIAGMSQEDLFAATIAGLQNVEDETERTYLAGQLLGRGATELGALLNTSAEDTQAMRDRVHELGGVMSDESVKAAAKFKDSLQDTMTAITGIKNRVLGEFLPALTTVMDGLQEVFAGDPEKGLDMISQGIDQVVAKTTEIMPRVLEMGGQILMALVQGIVTNIPMLITAMADGITSLAQTITDNTDSIMSTAGEMFMSIATALAEATPQILVALGSMLISLVGYVVEHIPQMAEAAGQLILTFVSSLANGIDPAMQAMNEVVQGALDAVGEFFKSMFDAGANLIQGLIEGIGSAIGGVGDAIMGGLNDAVGGVLSFLGIASPSKLFKWVGDMTMQGLTQGIEGGTPSVDSAMAAAATSMYDASDVGSRSFDSRPILEGMDALGGKMSNLGIYLDGKVLVGYIAPSMDRALVVA